EARPSEGVIGRAQNGDKDLCTMLCTCAWIDHRDRVSGIIGLHNRAGLMAVAIPGADAVLELTVAFTEPSISITVGMRGAVFFPQQHQRYPLALHLRSHLRPVGFAQVPGWTANTLEKDLLKCRIVIAAGWQWPAVQTRLPGAVQVGRHGRLAELQAQTNLAHWKPLFMRQPQYGSYVLHSHAPRLLTSWHVLSRPCSRPGECR